MPGKLQLLSSICVFLAVLESLRNCFALAAPTPQSYDTSLPRAEPGVYYLPDSAIVLDDGYELSIQGVLGAIVLLLTALGLWCRSYYDWSMVASTSRFLVGFVVAGLTGWILLANFEPEGTYGTNRQTVYLVAPVVCGLLGGLVMFCTLHLYIILLGGLGGLAAGLWVLGWRDGLTVQSDWGRAVLLVLLVLVGFVLAAMDPFFHIVAAALTGAYVLMLGLDVFFHTGFTYCFTSTLDNNPYHDHTYHTNRETYIIQGSMIVAFFVGILIQMTGRHVIISQHDYYFGKPGERPFWPMYMQQPWGHWPFWSRRHPPPPGVVV